MMYDSMIRLGSHTDHYSQYSVPATVRVNINTMAEEPETIEDYPESEPLKKKKKPEDQETGNDDRRVSDLSRSGWIRRDLIPRDFSLGSLNGRLGPHTI